MYSIIWKVWSNGFTQRDWVVVPSHLGNDYILVEARTSDDAIAIATIKGFL